MIKPQKNHYVCQACGATSARWVGKCGACEEWNTLIEESFHSFDKISVGKGSSSSKPSLVEKLNASFNEPARLETRLAELDRVTGGGIVPSSAILISGEPGIGKSTLLLQLGASLAQSEKKILYFAGEESSSQVRLRSDRLGLSSSPLGLVAETNVEKIIATLASPPKPDLVIIDSIQTLWSEEFEAAPGTVSQVRSATQELIRYSKRSGTALILVGHVTKDGQIAGPKIIEHMVDTVLYFEGDRGQPYRILRATKNRFGATDEIAVFEMLPKGLKEIHNPSELFLGERNRSIPGVTVFPALEGTRPILVEFQALVLASSLGTPRRAVVGWDANRLSMILAVLEARCGVSLSHHDIFLNVAGGLKIQEPAADLAVVCALLSAFKGFGFNPAAVCFGEISLSGAIRPTSQTSYRLKEAKKLGFQEALISAQSELSPDTSAIKIIKLSHVKDVKDQLFGNSHSKA